MSGTVEGERSFDLLPESEARSELLTMLNHTAVDKRIQLPFLFPKFLKVHFFEFHVKTLCITMIHVFTAYNLIRWKTWVI